MKKIVFVTGSRADYGIMKRLLQKLDANPEFELQIIATAMHMEAKYGYTYRDIEADGLSISRKIPLNIQTTSNRSIISSIAKLSGELIDYFEQEHPDLTLILGDRYEMLAVANVSLIYNVPICHLHGGEKTLGNYDDQIRNAITKMSHLHLTSTEEYRRRVIQMGENPERVINTGSLGVENVTAAKILTFDQLASQINLGRLREKEYYVCLYHPTTLEPLEKNEQILENLLSVLTDKACVFIGSNSDTGSDTLMNMIDNESLTNQKHYLFKSLHTDQYHSLVKHSLGLVGNSSSGLIEVPSLKVPTLNIGRRQAGRARGKSVIDTDGLDAHQLGEALSGLAKVQEFDNPYAKFGSSSIAYDAIDKYLKSSNFSEKEFFDIKFDLKK